MSTKEQQPLLFDDYDDYSIPSRWQHFQTISNTIVKNVNWLLTITTLVLTITLSVISSGFITAYINQALAPNQLFNNYDMSRQLLNIESIDDIEKLENSNVYSHVNVKKSRAELKMDLDEEDKIIDALKEDVKGQKGIEDRLMKQIKVLERERLKIIKEQKQHETNMIWIGIAMSSVLFIGSAFLFYALTTVKKHKSQENDNVSLQNQRKAIYRSPTKASNVTAAN